MKKIILLASLGFMALRLFSQNSISADAGYLRSHTNVAEYVRNDRNSSLFDTVSLIPNSGSFQAALTVHFDLGKHFFLATGFHYERKGMSEVDVTDTVTTYYVNAYQHYAGLSMLIEYQYDFRKSKFGILMATGPQVDFAVGKPNTGVLYSGKYYWLFMPFSKFSEVDFSWTVEAGPTFKLGPGEVFAKVCYRYGLSDILQDAYVIGRSSSFGISAGYSFRLTK